MRSLITTHFLVSANLLVLALSITVGVITAYTLKREAVTQLSIEAYEEATYIHTLAEITDHNGADEAIEGIIADCPSRGEFEVLIGKLGSLAHRDLLKVQQLFESCGNFYAERKALMVTKLQRELEFLSTLTDTIHTLDESTPLKEVRGTLQQLVTLEAKRSDFLAEQVVLQRMIISELISGKKVTSEHITTLTERARELIEGLGALDADIDGLRIQSKEQIL